MSTFKKYVITFASVILFFICPSPRISENTIDIDERHSYAPVPSYDIDESDSTKVIIDSGKNYRITDISEERDLVSGYQEIKYRYEIYNEQGKVVKSEIAYRINPNIRYIDDSLLEIKIGVGTGTWLTQYYDLENDIFSEIFESPILEKNGLVGYVIFDNSYSLVIRDIFEVKKLCKTYELDLSPVANPVDAIENVEFTDEYTFAITYLSGNDYKPKTENFNLYGKTSEYEDIDFIDEEAFEIIKDTYSKIDFLGEFKKGNTETYDFYKKQYLRLLNCEATFFDKRTQKDYYINEFNEMSYTYGNNLIYEGNWSDVYEPSNYVYYFFDMDEDGVPELCVTNEIRFIYIIKYEPDSNNFIMWHEVFTTWIRLLGSRKLWYYSGTSPIYYAHYGLDRNGEDEYSVYFYIEGYYNKEMNQDDTLYMVTLPQYMDKNNELSENMKKQAVVIENHEGAFYFRVTEEQFDELTSDFFEARDLAKKNIKGVTFTFDELFGEFSPN